MKDFETGHELFDHIIDFRMGSFTSILDKTYTESLVFLNALLSHSKRLPVYIITRQDVETPFNLLKVDVMEKSMNDLNLTIADIRSKVTKGVIIHYYLPHLLLKENEDALLKMFSYWSGKIADTELIEFFPLPQGAFPPFEKKLQALTDAVIVIKIEKSEDTYRQFFSIPRGSKPIYHLTEFPYIIENGHLLIKWGDEYRDKPPEEYGEDLEKNVELLLENLYSYQVVPGPFSIEDQKLPSYEYLLISQCLGRRLDEITLLFPEQSDYIIENLARWKLRGLVSFENAETHKMTQQIKPISLGFEFALSLPTSLTMFLLNLRRRYSDNQPRMVSFDAYMAMKKSAEALAKIFIPKSSEALAQLSEIESFFQEIASRQTAIEHSTSLGENPTIKLELEYLPKICELTLRSGYSMHSETREVGPNEWNLMIDDCHICRDEESVTPICQMLGGTIVGALSVVFKERFECKEIECKAMGNEACVFQIKKL